MLRPEYSPDTFFHWHTIPVRFRDLDVLNHVNNAVFSTYFEDARIHFVGSVPEFARALKEDKSFVLVKSSIEFLKPILYPSKLLVGSSVLSTGNTSIEAFQAIYNKDTKLLHAVAVTKGVWFDLNTQRPARLPEITGVDKMIFKK